MVIINPFSGMKNGRRLLKEIAKRKEELRKTEGILMDIVFVSSDRNSTRALARLAVRRRYQRLIAVGGDGTIHEVVNAIAGSDVSLGIIPAGTGNDFSRALKIPKNPRRALDVALFGKIVSLDLGKVNNRFFINVLSFGLDAKILHRFSELRKRHHSLPTLLLYFVSICQELFSPPEYPLTKVSFFESEEVLIESQETTDLIISNGPSYAMILRVAPESSFADNFFDICWLGKMGKLKIFRAAWELILGKPQRIPEATILKFSALLVSSPDNLYCQADGEVLKPEKEYKISIAPRALKVLVPHDLKI